MRYFRKKMRSCTSLKTLSSRWFVLQNTIQKFELSSCLKFVIQEIVFFRLRSDINILNFIKTLTVFAFILSNSIPISTKVTWYKLHLKLTLCSRNFSKISTADLASAAAYLRASGDRTGPSQSTCQAINFGRSMSQSLLAR